MIAGHVFNQFPSSPTCVVAQKWIYLFHMPLFVFISGYLSRKKSNKDFFISCWKLIEPLILFQVIARGAQVVASGTFSFKDAFTPWYVLWYLLSLLFWRTMLQLLPNKILSKSRLMIISTFAISLLAGFLPFNQVLSLQRTFSFMPFFFLGYYTKGKSIPVPSKFRTLCGVFLILTMLIPIFFSDFIGGLNHASPYGSPIRALSRLLVFGLSVPMSLAFMSICPTHPFATKQGRYTMQYYIFHAFLIRILMRVISLFELPTSFIAALIYTFVIVFVIGMFTRLPFFSKLTNPSSFLH